MNRNESPQCTCSESCTLHEKVPLAGYIYLKGAKLSEFLSD